MVINAYAKINLSLEVLGCRDDGYHNISSLMQDIDLYDIVSIEKCSGISAKYNSVHCSISGVDVYLCTSVDTIPLNDNNLAIKGAGAVLETMAEKGIDGVDAVSMYIDKRLPVAAGIAGGSGNAAAAMLGINALAGYPFSLRELMTMGTKVGADVPYSLMMNAKKNSDVLAELPGIEEASVAAITGGIGDIVKPVSPIKKYVIMANPGISVSTREAYKAIDELNDYVSETGLFTNCFEKYTLVNYPEACELKTAMEENLNADIVLMSGSGPTMVAYYDDEKKARKEYNSIYMEGWLKSGWRVWLTVTGGQ